MSPVFEKQHHLLDVKATHAIYINKNVNVCLFVTGNLQKFFIDFFEILIQHSNRIWECLYIVIVHYLPISIWQQRNDYFLI